MEKMTDEHVLSLLKLKHPQGMGRGGFIYTLDEEIVFDDHGDMILQDLELDYVNPKGPFKKWVVVGGVVETERYRYKLNFIEYFWSPLDESTAVIKYLKRFIFILRRFSSGAIDVSDINVLGQGQYTAKKEQMRLDTPEYFPQWIEDIKKRNPDLYY